jgi:L-ascorbate metabolism protein UlaG (beta-lactamase superfamily)
VVEENLLIARKGAETMKLLNLDITLIAHDTFRIAGCKVIYTDPFKVTKNDEAHVVLLSHEHFDHMSLDDLKKVIHPGTTIVASPLCKDALNEIKVREKRFLDPIAKTTIGTPKTGEVVIETVPAYNINKFREPGHAFHPKGEKRLGFIIHMDGTTVYFAGDTDFIPEMKSIKCNIALLPVSGTYVMSPEEAAEAAAAINPKIVVPMHYGAIVGTAADAQKFKSLVKNCQVEIL